MLCFYFLIIISFIEANSLSFSGQRPYGSMIFYTTGRAPIDYENYGCWCRTGSRPDKYVDEVDLCCKFRFNCYDLAMKSPKCNGILTEYSVQLGKSIVCIDNNQTCDYATCMCDKQAAECFGANLNKINDNFFNLSKKECRYEKENTTTPGVCDKAKWNSNGIAVARANALWSVFVDDNSNVYVTDSDLNTKRVLKWAPNATTGMQVADCRRESQSGPVYRENFGDPTAVFVDNIGNLYITSSLGLYQQSVMNPCPPCGFKNVVSRYGYTVEKWSIGATKGITLAKFPNSGNNNRHGDSYGLYVDRDDNIYLSDQFYHYVFKFSPNQQNYSEIVAGDRNGKGNGSHQLNEPKQIYVDSSYNIYIADSQNHRIQKWAPGAKQGVTVAGGNGQGLEPNQLNTPTGVWLDSYGNIYVCDSNNQRIQKWSVNANVGITVAGDYGKGSNPLQLKDPQSITLDSYGNIYVADTYNKRVQKYVLESPTSC
ncbi:unnamed protein product [Rotaria sordida]|uniref:Phospholipase A2-like central domain-containing protein n=1 Tax=Rotaria sordida TaxID=392033 RepID=A0A815IY04_9BILA|nr:unnamed protein product [Rotaria sordida]